MQGVFFEINTGKKSTAATGTAGGAAATTAANWLS